MKHQPHALTAVLLAAGALTFTACASGESLPEPASTAPSTPATADGEADQPPAEESDSKSDTRAAAIGDTQASPDDYSTDPTDTFTGGNAAQLRTTDIRVGSHEGYDRVVFEYTGDGVPQFNASYSEDPRQQASGNPLAVPGNAAFEIIVHGTSGDENAEAKYAGMTNLNVASGSITEVINGGSFEGVSQYFIGLDSQRPYKVTVLENPTRIAVDFQK